MSVHRKWNSKIPHIKKMIKSSCKIKQVQQSFFENCYKDDPNTPRHKYV